MVAENQTRRQAISQTLLAFDKAVEPGATAFFFYAGHGFEIAGQNFLLPTDVPPRLNARKSWCVTPLFSPPASSNTCKTRKYAPPSWCSTPAATIHQLVVVSRA
jgi:hypothetical protein